MSLHIIPNLTRYNSHNIYGFLLAIIWYKQDYLILGMLNLRYETFSESRKKYFSERLLKCLTVFHEIESEAD